MTLSLPPFTRAVTWLLAINTAVFLLLELFRHDPIDVARWVRDYLALEPQAVVHGAVWQLVTYSFLHFEFWHWSWQHAGHLDGSAPPSRGHGAPVAFWSFTPLASSAPR